MSDDVEILISLAVSMEKERAVKIVGDVRNERIGGKDEPIPTGFQAGFLTACEEILHRLEHDEWQYVCSVFGSDEGSNE